MQRWLCLLHDFSNVRLIVFAAENHKCLQCITVCARFKEHILLCCLSSHYAISSILYDFNIILCAYFFLSKIHRIVCVNTVCNKQTCFVCIQFYIKTLHSVRDDMFSVNMLPTIYMYMTLLSGHLRFKFKKKWFIQSPWHHALHGDCWIHLLNSRSVYAFLQFSVT